MQIANRVDRTLIDIPRVRAKLWSRLRLVFLVFLVAFATTACAGFEAGEEQAEPTLTGELLAFQARMGERPLLLPEQLPRSIDAIFATQRGEGDASDYEVVFAQGGWNAIVCVHHGEASCGQGAGDAIVSGEIGTGEKYSISLLDVTHIPNKLTQGEVEGFWTTTAIIHNPDWLNAE